MSPSTVKVHLVGARMLYRALRWAEVTDADPFRDVRPSAEVGRPATRRQAYSEAELQRLLALAEPVDRVVILLATDAGLRVSESVGLMWDAVDLERSQLLLPGSDGDAVRVVALTPALARALGQLPHDREGRVLGFTSDVWARRRLQHLCERAGVPYRGLDSLRQTAHAGHALSESLDRLPGGDRANVGPPKTHHLTGVPSQGALREELVRAVAEANRIHSYSALLLIRLEYLRSVLAERDPETEAAVLKAVAARLDRARRPYDFLAQTDDDTFAVLLRHIPSSAALASVADRLSNILRSHPIAIGGKEIPLEPAVGTIMGPGEPEQLISAALAALGHKES